MVTGRSVYERITDKVRNVDAQHKELSGKLNMTEQEIESIGEAREKAYEEIARVHMPELSEEIIGRMHYLREETMRIFQEKQRKRKSFDDLAHTTLEARNTLEQRLRGIDDRLDQATAAREQKEAEVDIALKNDPEYTTLLLRKDIAIRELASAEKDNEFAKQQVKNLRDYESNEFFSYLMQRRFGTPEYAGNALTRIGDAAIAKFIGYFEQKRNYDELKNLETYAKTFAERAKQKADFAQDAADKHKKGIEDRIGFTAAQDREDELDNQRDATKQSIVQNTQEYKSYTKQRDALDSTTDAYHKSALKSMKEFFKGQDLLKLREMAGKTQSPADDELVKRIDTYNEQIDELRTEAKRLKAEQKKVGEKLSGLQSIANEFDRRGYDSSRSRFRSFDIDSYLAGYMAGSVSSDSILSSASSSHYKESEPSYSSSSSYSSGSSWSGSDSWSSGGGFDSGGGFSSGGDF